MFGMYPKPLKYKSPKVQYLCERLGSTLVAIALNLNSREAVLTVGESEALLLMIKLYKDRLEDCGIGIATIQFTAVGGYGISVIESIREGDYEQANKSSEWWAAVECGRIDPMGW